MDSGHNPAVHVALHGIEGFTVSMTCVIRLTSVEPFACLRPRNLRITEEKEAEAIAAAAESGDAPERLYAINSDDAMDKDDYDQKDDLDRKDKTVVKVLSAS